MVFCSLRYATYFRGHCRFPRALLYFDSYKVSELLNCVISGCHHKKLSTQTRTSRNSTSSLVHINSEQLSSVREKQEGGDNSTYPLSHPTIYEQLLL